MVTTKFIDSPDTAVDTAVKALCMTRPHMRIIENTHVVVNCKLDPTKVLLVCGGGAGHEPSHVGFVDRGWLSAAVSGDVFASPPTVHVTAAIDYLHARQGPNGPGVLVAVKNYMGDILNFEFAVHEAQERGINVEMVMVADDACFGVDDVTCRRGIAGTVLLYKILGAAALRGENMAALKLLAGRISSGMRSVGASLSSCSLPGSKPLSMVPDGLVEVGLGIHGEKGLYQIPFEGAEALVSHLLSILLCGGKQLGAHEQRDSAKEWKGAQVALLVNNLGSTTDIEMGILTRHALEQLRQVGVDVVGVSVGRHMTALEMHGFSLTLLRFLNHDDVALLFDEQQAPLVPFTVPQFSPAPVPGPRSALQLAQEEQCGSQRSSVLGRVLESVFQTLRNSEDYLNELDAAVGDGDTGSGTRRAALKALELLPYLPLETNVSKAFALLAKAVADAFGGSSGPLYGAFLLAAGAAAAGTMRHDGASSVDAIRAALRAGSANIQRIARSKRGDRTMVDVLEALNESPQVNAATTIQEMASVCVVEAKAAAAATALLPAKHGRSRYLQGKELGQRDPGAELVVLWIEAAANDGAPMYGGLFKKRPREADAPANGNTLKGSGEESKKAASILSPTPSPYTVYHYPSSLPFPTVIDSEFPAEPYRSRSRDVKAAIHWGQRKLLLSEIQLLSIYARPNVSYHIVYAGAAPGTHLAFLDELFQSRHTWELVDPGRFDRPVLEPRPNFSLRNEFFTNATAYGINARRLLEVLPGLGAVYRSVTLDPACSTKKEIHEKLQGIVGTIDVARGTEDIPSIYEPQLDLPFGFELLCYVGMERGKPLMFVSDIRSGSVSLPNFEDHVAENMRAQECWCQILQGEYSMLKFRLPYTHKKIGYGDTRRKVKSNLIGSDGTVKYLRGDILLPIWTRPTSTEGRLVVPRGAHQVPYNVTHVENQFFFFNARVREQVHFNHILLPDEDLDHHYDAAAEVNCLLTYLRFLHPELKEASAAVLRREVKRVSASITAHLRVGFQDVIRRREYLVLKQARSGQSEEEGDESDDEAIAAGTTPNGEGQLCSSWETIAKEIVQAASRERARVVWRRSVEETESDVRSGVWVTTTMRQ